ncbi:MAG TPA: hypothetical protein VE962_07385, partial [Actinomycetota bacterium]|nr:hypothetical protein [Actinomycetota bacterium]
MGWPGRPSLPSSGWGDVAGPDPRDVVARKRDGRPLTEEEIRAVVLGYAREEVPDYLAAAFLMAA